MFKLYFVPDLFTFTHYTTVTLIRSMNKDTAYLINLVLVVFCTLLLLGVTPCFTVHTSV